MTTKKLTDRDRKIVRIAFMETNPGFIKYFQPIHKGLFVAIIGLVALGLVGLLGWIINLVFEALQVTPEKDRKNKDEQT